MWQIVIDKRAEEQRWAQGSDSGEKEGSHGAAGGSRGSGVPDRMGFLDKEMWSSPCSFSGSCLYT